MNNQNFESILRSYSTEISKTPIRECTINQIFNLVKDRCIENGVLPPEKIFGLENGCPICYNDYSTDNWVVLHPCGHLLCNTCLKSINDQIRLERKERKCPLCQNISKWIGPLKNNLMTSIPFTPCGTPTTPPLFGIGNPNNFNPPALHLPGLNRQFTANPFNNHHHSHEFIKSKPPIISEEKYNSSNDEIVCEISKREINIDDRVKKIGNLSIRCKELENFNRGVDLVIVMDVSGSMSSVANESIQILKKGVDCLSGKDRLCIITFDSDAKQLFPLQPMTNSIKNGCKEIISSCFTGGSTNLESAINLLIKTIKDGLQRDRPFKVILLSDGQPDNGRDGFHLVPSLYEDEIKPEIFSCTFGSSVQADTLKKLLLPQNLHYYKHISNLEEFSNLILEIGFDKNVVIGKELIIEFSGLEILSSLVKEEEGKKLLKIDQVKTGDLMSLPIEFIEEKTEINIHYQNLEGENKLILVKELEGVDNFILYHYWYKRILNMIRDLENLRREEKLQKIIELEKYVVIENLGDFLEEIKDMIEKTKNMINERHAYQHYNTYSSTVERLSSFTSPTVQRAYRNHSC